MYRGGKKMINFTKCVTLVFMLAAGACVPMEQASLTYASKTTMGVGAAVGTQDTPGLEVTIGFKEANIALVPVAVAKYCYKATEAQCQDPIYQMQMVAGGKMDSVESPAVQNRIEEINRELEQLFSQKKLESDRLSSLKSRIAMVEAADIADAELAKPQALGSDVSPEAVNARAALTAKSALRPANFNVADARNEVAQLDAAELDRTGKIDKLRQEQAKLSGQLDANSNRERKDSYSVYGKFSGSATGDSQGAGLTAGKIFATGVAAQNLTEFATKSDCLANIALLAGMMPKTNDAEKAALLKTAGEVCKSTH